ncbi:hypothetical protein C5167_050256 [Papaver somniferum]|uniref:Uncharacterized protein n=1 Tax=Papaver somniferum TaxID=3469 RepID=A0A4Y7KPJ2_PAPSO|nr:hypothetical protein C5167_050256 [Papaver somniferum]
MLFGLVMLASALEVWELARELRLEMLKHLGQVSPIIPVLEESLSSDSAGVVGKPRSRLNSWYATLRFEKGREATVVESMLIGGAHFKILRDNLNRRTRMEQSWHSEALVIDFISGDVGVD